MMSDTLRQYCSNFRFPDPGRKNKGVFEYCPENKMAHFDDHMEGEAALSRGFSGVNSARHPPSLGSYGVAGRLALQNVPFYFPPRSGSLNFRRKGKADWFLFL